LVDLLTGLISDPSAVSFYTKEALRLKLSLLEIYVMHISEKYEHKPPATAIAVSGAISTFFLLVAHKAAI